MRRVPGTLVSRTSSRCSMTKHLVDWLGALAFWAIIIGAACLVEQVAPTYTDKNFAGSTGHTGCADQFTGSAGGAWCAE